MILVKAGEVDLYLEGGTSLALPRNLGMIHDESGEQLDRCSLFFGPFDDEGAFDEELPQVAAYYFGSDYVARRAGFDVPDSGWESVGRVKGIVYFRPGEFEDDWAHDFVRPVELLASGPWWRIDLPDDCEVNWRGIVHP